nr:methylmalonyl-CoA carboxyltransferase [Actinomycetes bacterium]
MTSATESSGRTADHEIDIHTTAGKLADLQRRAEESLHPVGEAAVDMVHARGKLTARERILALLDEGSFVELDALAKHRSTNFGLDKNRPTGDGVVTGYGTIDGRDVCVFSQDATVFGGSLGEVYGEKIVKVQELAIKTGRPLIGINDGAGARIQEGVVSLGHYSRIFRNNILASGVVPQISLIMGAAAGGHVYSPALTDFVIMVDQTSQMFITGPDVIKTVTGEDVTMEELGGAHTHMAKSGTVHYVASGEQDALDYVRELLGYLPPNSYAEPPRYPAPHPGPIEESLTEEDIELDTLIPDSPNQPYDMHEVITRILDDDEFLEVQADYAGNIIVGFGRVDGRPVGIVANQP